MPLIRLSSSWSLWLSRSAPPSLPTLASYSSWHSRQAGWCAIRSARCLGCWLLLIRCLPTPVKLARLGLHGLP